MKRHSAPFLQTPRWKALRQQALRRDHYQCKECGAGGRLEVHHVKPVRTHPELVYDLDNLLCLCKSCHVVITRKELGLSAVNPKRQAWTRAVKALLLEKLS